MSLLLRTGYVRTDVAYAEGDNGIICLHLSRRPPPRAESERAILIVGDDPSLDRLAAAYAILPALPGSAPLPPLGGEAAGPVLGVPRALLVSVREALEAARGGVRSREASGRVERALADVRAALGEEPL